MDITNIALPAAKPKADKEPIFAPDPSGGDDDYLLYLDNTALETFETCGRKAEFYLVRRRQAIASPALLFGAAAHVGLELIYKGYDVEQSIVHAVQNYEQPQSSTEWRTKEHLFASLYAYVRHYVPDTLRPEKPEHVEIPFAYPIGEFELNATLPYSRRTLLGNSTPNPKDPLHIRRLTVLWTGKVDLIAPHMGELAVVDHKTTSMGGPTFYEQFRLSQPVHGYAWAGSKFIGEPIKKFWLNALILRKPSRTGVSREFDRRVYPITEEKIREFLSDVTAEIAVFIHHLTQGYYPKSPVWCMGKYGRCPYHDVCTMPLSAQPTLLNSDEYENVTWSPLNDDNPTPPTLEKKRSILDELGLT